MKRRAVRWTLVTLFAGAAAATLWFIATTESQIRADATAARDFEQRSVAALRAALELRAAQQAYVAAGQGDEFWIAKAGAAMPEMAGAIAGLRVSAVSAEAQTAMEAATAALRDFEQMDKRAREYVRGGHRLLASDLIFTDGLELTGAVMRGLDEARTAENVARDAYAAALRQSEAIALASCGALALIVTLLLLPGAANREEIRAAPLPIDAAFSRPSDEPIEPLDLSFTHEIVKPAREGAPMPAPGLSAAGNAGRAEGAIDLGSLASLCTELGRVVDTESLPALLERAAAVLDAPGIVVWIADPDGRELSATVGHGYPQQVLNRLGAIPRDAANATAAAFRTGLVQTVKSDTMSLGAIAAPLVSPAGAVGVMAAEVRGEGEQQPAKLAAASIVAAQLATLVGPPASRAREAAGA